MIKLVLVRHGESSWNKENRFTGWTDVDLSDKGIEEAHTGGKALKEQGFTFDIAFTSVLKRAIRTLWIVLDEMDLMWIPVINSWRLNERHYGLLQGKNKDTMRKIYGEDKVQEWRRGYEAKPPEDADGMSESLKDTEQRVLPYWEEEIKPKIKNNRIIISAHGNSIRALIKIISPREKIEKIEIPVGIPMIYEFDEDIRPLKRYFLSNNNLD